MNVELGKTPGKTKMLLTQVSDRSVYTNTKIFRGLDNFRKSRIYSSWDSIFCLLQPHTCLFDVL